MIIITIGLGLIGGSMAMELKRIYPEARHLGIDANEHHLSTSIGLGIIDAIADDQQLSKADIVLVSTPVDILPQLLKKVLDNISKHCLVMDTGSTKSHICKSVQNHLRRENFVAMHPIAGTEFSGPQAAFLGLFKGKTNILCEVEHSGTKQLYQAKNICLEMGMHFREMKAEEHDIHIAYVSHLSHISSFMLGKTVIQKEKDEQRIFDMAGSGFESTVRLAKSSPYTWTAIFKENKTHVLSALHEYIANLQAFEALLSKDEYAEIYNELENTNAIKSILKGITNKT